MELFSNNNSLFCIITSCISSNINSTSSRSQAACCTTLISWCFGFL